MNPNDELTYDELPAVIRICAAVEPLEVLTRLEITDAQVEVSVADLATALPKLIRLAQARKKGRR